jgi:ferredoxin
MRLMLAKQMEKLPDQEERFGWEAPNFTDKCWACGICAKICPNGIISLIEDTERIVVKCSNHYKGAKVRTACDVGCIACGKCERTCPHDAIHLIDNLATIDYDKCTACGACVSACPVKCIHVENLICGSHFE